MAWGCERWACEGLNAPLSCGSEFYHAARDDCLRAVLVSVGDRNTAEDLVAEAFARAWARWRQVRRHPAPRAWVVTTAFNANVSAWRRRRREMPLFEHRDPGQFRAAGMGADPDVMAALRRLPDRQRQVIALRFLLDLDTSQTAKVLGMAPGTVTAHTARAIARLRAEFIPQGQQEAWQ